MTGPRSPRAQRYQRRAVFAIRFRGDQNSGPASHSLIAGYMVMAFTSDIRGQQGGRAAPTATPVRARAGAATTEPMAALARLSRRPGAVLGGEPLAGRQQEVGPRIEWLRGSGGTLETVFPALTRRSDLRCSGRQPRSGVRLTDARRRAGNAARARPPGCLAR
ncbi:MAG TPA: hypothetical protein VF933_23380 [Streptosporangiaceae bacterium]